MGRKIQFAANAGILVVCAVLVLRFIGVSPAAWRAADQPSNVFREIGIGEHITLSQVAWADSDRTAVLVFTRDCRFCVGSLPFYRRLADVVQEEHLRLVLVSPDAPDEIAQYLRTEGVPVKVVRPATELAPAVTRTPTLILVDREGKATGVWSGQVSPATENYILDKLRDN